MAEPAGKLWTLDEFLAFDDGTDTRYELIAGEIVAMTPPSAIHGALAARLAILFGRELSRRGEVALSAGIVPASPHAYYQADLAVTCAPVTGQPFVGAPRVIAEVLSPSTAATASGLPQHPLGPGHPAGLQHRAPDRALAARGGRLEGPGLPGRGQGPSAGVRGHDRARRPLPGPAAGRGGAAGGRLSDAD